jgi:hypothetical protein
VLQRRLGEQLVLRLEQCRIDAALVLAEALGDHVAQVLVHGVLRGAQEIRIIVGLGQVQHDVGAGGDGMRPLDVERDLFRPPDHVAVGRVEGREAVRGDLRERPEAGIDRVAQPVQAGQAVGGIVEVQLRDDVRRLVGVDDDDRLALAGEPGADQVVDAVRVPHLVRVVADNTRVEPNLAGV